MITKKELLVKLKEGGYLTGRNENDIWTFAKDIRKRLRNDWDCVIAITGRSGVGKSCLAFLLDILIDDHFSIDNNLSLIPNEKQLKKQFCSLKRYSIFHVDEAVRALLKYKWYDKLQQALIELYETERWRNICTLLLIPRFKNLTENFRNHRVDINIHIYDRGRAIVFFKDPDKDIDDPWHMKENLKKKEKGLRYKVIERSIDEIMFSERKSPTYGFEFRFPDFAKIDPETWQYYESLKIKSREDEEEIEKELETISQREERYKLALGALVNVLRRDLKLTYKKISTLIDFNSATISSYHQKYLRYKKRQKLLEEGEVDINTVTDDDLDVFDI